MEHSPRWGTTGTDTRWETRTRGERERGGTYRVGTGSELSGVNRSCVRTGSDTPEGHDGYLQAMFQHGFVPLELPGDFPRAIRQVLLTVHPSSRQRLIDVAVGSAW